MIQNKNHAESLHFTFFHFFPLLLVGENNSKQSDEIQARAKGIISHLPTTPKKIYHGSPRKRISNSKEL